jgi:small subunit ribosomal protein S17
MAEQTQPVVHKKELVGEVVSDKMDKTIVVQVKRRVQHPRYKKVITKYKKFYVHDEKSEAGVGDRVRIVESRPLSKLKRWALAEIVEKSRQVEKVEA